MEQTQTNLVKKYHRKECDDLLKRKFFYTPSFEIYGGIAGLYDYGPLGSQLKSNVEQLWRQHFVLEEDMLEVGCCNLTPEEVLQTSGHVEKFADFMVKDIKTGQCHRADKLIQEFIDKLLTKKKDMKAEEKERIKRIQDDAESMNAEQLNQTIKELKIKAPDTSNDLSEALPFNLMFETQIGPSGHHKGFLRPETAQGIFLNFRRLLEYNNGKMPLAAAQIGLGFRNEIHPKQGLLRVREFSMAEIEHFVDPLEKSYPKFNNIANLKLPLFTSEKQETTREIMNSITMQEAVEQGIIANETLAYYMARTYQFLLACGINESGIRFRQHKKNEMAHYACDCWDAEVETSYGFIEVAGHADRSCFDLTRHAKKTKTELKAGRLLKEKVLQRTIIVSPNKKEIGKNFKQDSKLINEAVEEWEGEQKQKFMKEMEENGKIVIQTSGKELTLTKEHISFDISEKMVQEEKYVPSVIEPSFGIGRIVYCIFEHCFKIRPDNEQRTYFMFPPQISPLKCSILPLIDNPQLKQKVYEIKSLLTKESVTSKIDDSGQSIGRRYARTDECGIPFAITVDFDTLEDNTVTLRDLDTMKQVRMKINELGQNIVQLSNTQKLWDDVLKQYPVCGAKDDDAKE